MGRSLKKGPYVVERLLEKVMKADASGSREPIKTWARACTIVPEFVGKHFAIHDGRKFVKLYVTEDMVEHRLGEFAPTRTFRGHGGKASKHPPVAAVHPRSESILPASRSAAADVMPSIPNYFFEHAHETPGHEPTIQYHATHRFARISVRKVRPLLDLIRGHYADDALDVAQVHAASRGADDRAGAQKSPWPTPKTRASATSAS